MATICIDARLWGIANTGIGRYIENLIDHLPGEVVLIVPPDLKHEPKLAKFKKYYAHFHPYANLAQLEMLWLLSFIRPRVLHVPHFTVPVLWPGKMVVTIHDLIKHFSRGMATTTRHPFIYWFKYFQYLVVLWLSVHRANHIITPVNYWKDILLKKYHLSPAKISVTYEGVAPAYFQKTVLPVSIGSAKPYVIYTGNLYPHKNIPVLFSAIKLLEGKVNLVISCARSVFTKRVEDLIVKDHLQNSVKFLGLVPDVDLVSLYRQSLAFVTPSLIEGFGLSGLEAMAAGTPVIAARASCLPEVYGDAALFFDPHDPADLVARITSLLTDVKLRQQLIAKGKKQVKKYSWSNMASQTWQIYQNALH